MTLVRLAWAVVLTFVGVAASAQSESSYTAQIVEYGIYTHELVAPSSGVNETMKSSTIKNICHAVTTTDIPARDYVKFGFRYRVDGPGRSVSVRNVIRYPNHLVPPSDPQVYVTNEEMTGVATGQVTYRGWTTYQSRPGTWTFEIFHLHKKLAEITFTVVPADNSRVIPESFSSCFPVSSLPVAADGRLT